MNLVKLFDELNTTLFDGKINSIPVKYSKRMTRCAGIYTCNLKNNQVILGSECIKIADRNFSDKTLKGILSHEMIHAYLTQNGHPREHHGYRFKQKMSEIRKKADFEIHLKHTPQEEEIKTPAQRHTLIFEKIDGNKSVAIFNGVNVEDFEKIKKYAKGFLSMYQQYIKADFGVSVKNTEFYPHKRRIRGPIYFVNNNYPVKLENVLFSVEKQ